MRLTCPPVVRHVIVIASPGSSVAGSIVNNVMVIGCGVGVNVGRGETIGRGDGLKVAEGSSEGAGAIVAVAIDGQVAVAAIDVGATSSGVGGRVPQPVNKKIKINKESVAVKERMLLSLYIGLKRSND